MKIAVSGGKGGTGKTIVATSLAIELAKEGKTILADADAECPNDHLMLSIERKKFETLFQPIPKWDFNKCVKCGKCAEVCKQDAIVFVKGRFPAFVKDLCIGCRACMVACPENAITETKKEIGTVFTGKNYGVELVSGELKLGELASGEVVAEVRKNADSIGKKIKAKHLVVDSAAGVGCPVIASIMGTDFVVAVTEPTPSALHDLKRAIWLARHFEIPCGIVLNKFDLDEKFCKKIEEYAKEKGVPVLGRIPYRKEFVDSTIKMKPVTELNPEYRKTFREITEKIKKTAQAK